MKETIEIEKLFNSYVINKEILKKYSKNEDFTRFDKQTLNLDICQLRANMNIAKKVEYQIWKLNNELKADIEFLENKLIELFEKGENNGTTSGQ